MIDVRISELMICVLDSMECTLKKYGICHVKRKSIDCRQDLLLKHDVTTFIGLIGDVSGNITYSFPYETAKKIASSMLMTPSISQFDEISHSALSELTNMMTGNATIKMFEHKCSVDITPPSLLIGKNTQLYLNSSNIYCVRLETNFGEIEVNFGVKISA